MELKIKTEKCEIGLGILLGILCELKKSSEFLPQREKIYSNVKYHVKSEIL